MNKKISAAAIVAALAVLCSASGWLLAQTQPGMQQLSPQRTAAATPNVQAPPAGGLGLNGIAIVDVPYIFKNHARFKTQIQGMEQKVRDADTSIKKDQEALKAKAEEVKGFQPGSPDYKRAEAEALRMQGDLSLKVSLQKKELLEQEGKIYYTVSMEIDDAVKQLALQNGIALVLRFNGDPIQATDRQDILRGINKPIVFYDQRMDITPYVLQNLNRGAAGTGPIGVAPPGARTR